MSEETSATEIALMPYQKNGERKALVQKKKTTKPDDSVEPSRSSTTSLLVLGLISLASLGMAIFFYGQVKTCRVDRLFVDRENINSLRSSSVLENLENGAVAADHVLCSQMGLDVLKRGGNAIDSGITTALCLGVANPASSGLGGGAFLLAHGDLISDDTNLPDFEDARNADHSARIHSKNGKHTEVIDCREVAPSAAGEDMYVGLPPLASVRGGLAIGVIGELKCLELAHARFGTWSWADLVQPALDLCQDGVPVNANLEHEIQIEARKYHMEKNVDIDYGLRKLLTHNDNWDKPLLEGERLHNPTLCHTLTQVRDKGADALYQDLAEALANDIQAAGGIVTKEDIQNYRATLRTPVVAHDVSGFSIVGVPPPSSGGATIVGAARFLAGYNSPLAAFSDTLARHRQVEALKHAFAIRMSLADPAFDPETVHNATQDLLVGPYMEELRKSSHDSTVLPMSQYGGAKWAQLEDADGNVDVEDAQEGDRRRRLDGRRFGYLNDNGTSHFSIVDKDGNAVSMTTSVNTYFGSNVVSSSTGIVLSNTMDDFSNPGRPNYFGLHPSPANYIKPGKKPLSSMAPTMLFRRHLQRGTGTLGDMVLVLGASGGPKIISAVTSVIANYLLLGMPLFESIVRPRLHDQLIYHGSATTTVENMPLAAGPIINVSSTTRDALRKRGHYMLDVDYEGTVQAIAIDQENSRITAVCDVRKGGSPAGY